MEYAASKSNPLVLSSCDMLPLTVRSSTLVQRHAVKWKAHSRLTWNGVAPPSTVSWRFSFCERRIRRACAVVRIPLPRPRRPLSCRLSRSSRLNAERSSAHESGASTKWTVLCDLSDDTRRCEPPELALPL
eukprot:scaffold192274_cov37-Tisochrysis_lutea.AAC.1